LAAITFCSPQIRDVATIAGRITDAVTLAPVGGATVRAWAKGQSAVSTQTDSTRSYSLKNVPATSVYVSAFSPSYLLLKPQNVFVRLAAHDLATRDFVLSPRLTISGTVTDFDGEQPLEGCQVTVFRRVSSMGEVWYESFPASDVNPTNGQYLIRGLESGDYVLEVAARDLEPFAGRGSIQHKRACHGWTYYGDSDVPDNATLIHLDSGDAVLNVRLAERPLRAVSGTVSVPYATGERHLSIQVRRADLDGEVRTVVDGLQGPGPFRVTNLAPGVYTLVVADWGVATPLV
jgi:hypothetical protein